MPIIQRIKFFLKRILPPPTNSFLREMENRKKEHSQLLQDLKKTVEKDKELSEKLDKAQEHIAFIEQELNLLRKENRTLLNKQTGTKTSKQSGPKVSVIIPAYNTEDYLRECLESAVNQTLRDIEIICVDDGSTDASLAIMKEYQARDPRIIIISQPNKGVSAARNAAMRCAEGRYVCFIDSDDYLDTETLEKTVPLAEENNLDVLVFQFTRLFMSEDLKNLFKNRKMRTMRSAVCTGLEFMKEEKKGGTYNVAVAGKLMRRSLLTDNDISFKEGIIHEDNLFCFLMFMAAERVLAIPEVFYHRRVRPASIMTSPKSHKNVEGYFGCATGILSYALSGDHTPEEDQEIKKAYGAMIRSAKQQYIELTPEEQGKVSFRSRTEEELFKQLILK